MFKVIGEIKLNIILTGMFIFWLTLSLSLKASNYVKIAAIGTYPQEIDNTKGMQNIVNQVIHFWENKLMQVLPDKPDLIVLSEVCDRPAGISKNEMFDYYKVRGNQVQDYFASVAKENKCHIVFGTHRKDEEGSWRNSSVLIDRQGNVAGIYDKKYPTIGEMERGIIAGDDAPVFKCDFGTVACAICFDLNFTEFRDQYAAIKPDIILFSSNYHGGLMQADWAYTCRSYFIGAIGPKSVPSEIRNPLGEVVSSSSNYNDFTVGTINLDSRLVHLDYNSGRLKKLKQKYRTSVTISDPGRLGCVLISSEHNELSIDDMIKEFDIELLDDYFNRSRKFRAEQLK